ncbi:unnamed protein product [Spodoptera littoralis]|uniref:Integrator complex subunit 1 n=1 Tax=Spodoptera littoralis TaxID=7109 RepID=A0A9P0I0K5_SPOLI|nr:unnamed protein product [Spodoptera littoralis]CAH1637960.1 unnamed protein product [Spodoptera littoralis]
MDRGKMPSAGRGAKSKAPQHPQDIFALGSKSTVVVSRDPEKRNIHKPSTSGVERKREPSGFGSQPPSKRARIGSPAEAVGGTSLEVDPVDLVYIEDALNERCWVECSWCKCFVENVVTAFSTKQPPSHLIPTDNTLVMFLHSCYRYSTSYEAVETLVLEAIKEQIQRRSAAPDAIGKGFLKLLSATCGFPEIRMISASRLEAWLHSGKLWRCAQELLAYVCCNCDACGPTAARDHEVLAQLARMRLKTKPLQAAYQACLREMVSDSPPLLRSVVTHTIYNELSNVRSPNNMAELVLRPEDYLRPLRALTREVVRAARADAQALLPLARALAQPPPHEPPQEVMFVEPAETYSKVDNWPPESERAATYRLCCEAPLPQNTLLRVIFIGLSKDIPVSPAEVFELVEQLVRRACALPAEENPLQVDKLEIADYIFQLCQFNPPDNITLPAGYTPPALAITSLYWRGWILLTMLAAHNPQQFAERAAAMYPTLRALIEMCITNKPSIEWSTSTTAEAERAEAERAAILQLETHLAAASNSKMPVNEHNSRLLSQLTTLEPLGPARKPPQAIIETLQAMSSQMRLGKLLCRQPALLLDLVERHGTRRAMPWLHQLLRHDQLELSVLPVQCLCEFLSAGGAGGEVGKAGELCGHLRRTVADSEAGARAVLHYYMTRLAHTHAPTRASANRGLKLVLQSSDDTSETDYNADVGPDEWLELVWALPHWEAVRDDVVLRVRTACAVECVPRHLAAYIAFLQHYVACTPALDHTDLVLDLGQVIMERAQVMGNVLGTGERTEHDVHDAHDTNVHELQRAQHRALYSLTKILYDYLQKLRSGAACEASAGSAWSFNERVSVQWPSGRTARMHLVLAHAYVKLLCIGPSMYDTNQEMYSWLMSVWVGSEAPAAYTASGAEACLLPDWLRLHMVRSARPPLLEAGMRALPAPKLALFIQTFGMPVQAMSALLSALDACPAGALSRLGVERGYMSQLLGVQRARGATGGHAFAATLRLTPLTYPPALEAASPSTLEALGNRIISSQDTRVIVDVITHILEKSQDGHYESKIKHEDGSAGPAHVFSRGGLGCGLLLDWMSELQREALGPSDQRHRQWLVSECSAGLRGDVGGESSRVAGPGQDHAQTLRARRHAAAQLPAAGRDGPLRGGGGPRGGARGRRGGGAAAGRRAPAAPAARRARAPQLLAVAAAAQLHDPLLLLLLYMKVPKILPLVLQSGPRSRPLSLLPVAGAAASSTSATDRVSHALLTAIAAPAAHSKDYNQKLWRMEAEVRGLWARVGGAGSRALGLAAALLRGAGPQLRYHTHVLAALEVLPDHELFAPTNTADLHSILECFLALARSQPGGAASPLLHRVSAILRRYLACRPQLAGALLHQHKDTIANTPALSSLQAAEVSAPASAAPPPLALQALQRRCDTPDNLHWMLQEIEAWGSRRGGAWGGGVWAGHVLRCAAPHAAAPHAALRHTALSLLAKLLPAVTDTTPGLQAVLECLDSHQPEVTQSLLDKLPDILVGMQEHAAKILMRVFELGLKSRHPVEPCIAKCVTTINLHRGC